MEGVEDIKLTARSSCPVRYLLHIELSSSIPNWWWTASWNTPACGCDNLIAGVDCGFGTFAGRLQVDSKIVWMKLAALSEGARLASKQLW